MKNMTFMKTLSNLAAVISIIVSLIFATACGSRKTDYIFVLDLTESVSAQSRGQSFEAIKTRVRALKRGDTLTVIPLTADAQIETSGNVLHLSVGEKRELADADLDAFFTLAAERLSEMQEKAKTYKQTDLLGAWQVVSEEIAVTEKENRRLVVAVFSDLVHSTEHIRFESSRIFANSDSAVKYADESAAKTAVNLQNAEIYLGLLESTDLEKTTDERRLAVREFWREFLQKSGAKHLQISTDGTGQFEKFLTSANESS